MNSKLLTFSLITIGTSLAAGCATNNRTAQEFGDSVRQVTAAQTYDPIAALNPDPDPVLGGDPERLNKILDGHREDVASPDSTSQPVTVNIGGN